MYNNPYEYLSGSFDLPKLKEVGFQERAFDTGKIKLNYAVGPNNGDPLVLIPAQMGIWESYQKVMEPLSRSFQVYAIDIRGHGKSSWTPGEYSWQTIGEDMQLFLEKIVQRPAIIAGNSSGGIIALWCGAHVPEYVKGVILEDDPVFSAEMPRFKEKDRFVYNGLKRLVDNIGDIDNRNLADYFKGTEVPVSETRLRKMPDWFMNYLRNRVRRFEQKYPDKPVEVGFSSTLRLLMKSLSMFDPDFARAFVDGRFYGDFSHEEALKKLRSPLLVLHADWKRYPEYGLVGAMDDEDAKRILEIVPHVYYKRIKANHVIHVFEPEQYVEKLLRFAKKIENTKV